MSARDQSAGRTQGSADPPEQQVVVRDPVKDGTGDDGVDWIGSPLTQGGALLQIAKCQLVRSGLFHLVLTPDYDDATAMHGAGIVKSGAGLEPPSTATSLRIQGGKRRVQDGPFADAKEQLGGFYVIDVPDLDTALEWAARAPCATTGGVEVRPIHSGGVVERPGA